MLRHITEKKQLSNILKKIRQQHTTFILIGFRYLTFGSLIKSQIVTIHECNHLNCTFDNEFRDHEIQVKLGLDKFWVSDTGRLYFINFNNEDWITDTVCKLERIEKMPDGIKFLDKVFHSDMPIKRVDKDEEIGYKIRDFEDQDQY